VAYNVLIVDDSATTRAIIARTLHIVPAVQLGEVFEASNGQEALEVLDQNWVDMVFADINMPVMDGVAMVEQMAMRKDMERIPVVIVSTEGSETRIEELLRKGVRAYIRKPFTAEQVGQVFREILGDADGF